MIRRSTNIRATLRSRQRGFMLNPFRFAGGAPGGDPHFDNVSLLLHFEGAIGTTVFTDSSKYAHAVTTPGNVVLSTAAPMVGAACAVSGNAWADHLSIPNSPAFDFGSGDFTLETWIVCGELGSSGGAVFGRWERGAPPQVNADWLLLIGSDRRMAFHVYDPINPVIPSNASTFLPNDGAWRNVAVTRKGSTFRMFVNGVLVSSGTSAITVPNSASQVLRTGVWGDTANSRMAGRLDELRITNGVARYTADYTPSTEPFPNF